MALLGKAYLMNLCKDPESWARVDPEAVVGCSHGHAVYVLKMALLDIAKLADAQAVGGHEALAWHCCDERYPWIQGIVTTSEITLDAWRDSGIKYQPLYPLASQPSPAATVETGRHISCAPGGKPYADSHNGSSAATGRETALEAAALDFIAKVDRGEARSKHSYAAFKAALGIPAVPQAAQVTSDELETLISKCWWTGATVPSLTAAILKKFDVRTKAASWQCEPSPASPDASTRVPLPRG